MGIAERQARDRKRRVDVILDAATKIVAEKGIQGATMDDIASAAELGKATIYNYFASKQLLLAALDLRGTRIEAEGFRRAYDAGSNGLDRTLRIVRFYFQYAMEYPVCFQAKVQMGRIDATIFAQLWKDSMVQEYVRAVQGIHQILTRAIADGINGGSIRSDLDPQRMSLLLWCQSNGVIETIQNRGELITAVRGVTMDQIRDDFFRAMERQLTGSESHPATKTAPTEERK